MELFNPFSLLGKQVLITGASSGIGRSIAVACAKMGATVCITGRDEHRLHDTFMLLPAGEHVELIADLTSEEDMNRLVNGLPELHGVVHCAGIGSNVLCKSIQAQNIDDIFNPNFKAPVLLQKALLEKRILKKASSVVFIASLAACFANLGNAVYSASKGAIISYSKVLALEVAPRLIRVNCVCPAMIWTNFTCRSVLSKDDLERDEKRYPLKRYGNPEDVANLVIYLLSDASSWVTGSTIDITGGVNLL